MDHLAQQRVGGAREAKERRRNETTSELAISAEKVGFLIEKTREFDVKESTSDPDGERRTERAETMISNA
jgi:hypothetical protein